MNKVTVLIKERSTQYEGLRTSLGLLLEDLGVRMFVLDHEIDDFSEAYSDNLGFFDEMGGEYYSNNPKNVTKYKFQNVDTETITEIIRDSDLIIPF